MSARVSLSGTAASHVDLDDVGNVLVGQVLVEGWLVVRLADIVDWVELASAVCSFSSSLGLLTQDTNIKRSHCGTKLLVISSRRARKVDGVDLSLDRGVFVGCMTSRELGRSSDGSPTERTNLFGDFF